jgi:adenosylhomocysteine nucleosidase
MRHVVVLAPMPLEVDAITTAFGLSPTSNAEGAPWTGRIGASAVTAVHIGMGPPLTRAAVNRVLDQGGVDHVMNAGICGGLDPDLPVGTLINPEFLVLQSTGARYMHKPPGDAPLGGTLSTAEQVTFDIELSERLFAEGCIAVDMESAAVAEVCEARGVPWSVYRCIGDRYFDGLLDPRLVAMTNPDGSGNRAEIERLLASEPDLQAKLERLAKDTANAARVAAEAAVRGCLALDG